MFTKVAASNAFLLCAHILLSLLSGEVYDSLSWNWDWLSDLIWPTELGICDAVTSGPKPLKAL